MNDIFDMLAGTGASLALSGTEDTKEFHLTVERYEHGYIMHLEHEGQTVTKEIIGKRSDDALVRYFIRPAIRELRGMPLRFDSEGQRI